MIGSVALQVYVHLKFIQVSRLDKLCYGIISLLKVNFRNNGLLFAISHRNPYERILPITALNTLVQCPVLLFQFCLCSV